MFNEDDLFAELDRDQVKYTRENVLFIVRDVTGQIVWLETGNEIVGLTHIIKEHARNFKDTFNVNEDQIPEYLKKVVTLGKLVSNKVGLKDGKLRVTRIFYYEGTYNVLTALGTNGFIISAYPKNQKKSTDK